MQFYIVANNYEYKGILMNIVGGLGPSMRVAGTGLQVHEREVCSIDAAFASAEESVPNEKLLERALRMHLRGRPTTNRIGASADPDRVQSTNEPISGCEA